MILLDGIAEFPIAPNPHGKDGHNDCEIVVDGDFEKYGGREPNSEDGIPNHMTYQPRAQFGQASETEPSCCRGDQRQRNSSRKESTNLASRLNYFGRVTSHTGVIPGQMACGKRSAAECCLRSDLLERRFWITSVWPTIRPLTRSLPPCFEA